MESIIEGGTMQEIRQAVILAAGSSRRMGDLTKNYPKCLLPYNDELILARLIRQLINCGIQKIVISVGYHKEKIKTMVETITNAEIILVENDRYEEDVNIYSMKLALDKITDSFCIFEADTIMENALVKYVTGDDFEGKSVWFTKGKFNSSQYGGILNTDKFGNINDIKIVPEYKEIYKDYSKLTGLMRVNKKELTFFKQLVNGYCTNTIKQYYLIPWMVNLINLPCIEADVQHYLFQTFNKPEEYEKIKTINFDEDEINDAPIEMIDTDKLKHIEQHNNKRVKELLSKIKSEGVWTKPLYIEKNHNLTLDGQHRLEVAKKLGLKKVPCQLFDYQNVKVWSLRKEEIVNPEEVIKRVDEGNIYPYKTVKHKFPKVVSECKIKLKELK